MKKRLLLLLCLVVSFSAQVSKAQDWNEIMKALADDGAGFDYFGHSVSISGDVAIVGAYQDNDNGSNSGSAYIFEKNGVSWIQQQKLTPSDGAANNTFGYSVSVSGDVAIVGDRSNSGSAYIFEKNDGVWTQKAKLTASDGEAYDRFGYSVSVSGDVAIVGAYYDGDNSSQTGSAYIFEKSDGSWPANETQKLTASDFTDLDEFGYSVSISGDVAIVGAYRNEYLSQSGAAYIFEKSDGSWPANETQKLTASDAFSTDWFGYSVSISGDVAIVGAKFDDDKGNESGSAYIFEKSGEDWIQMQKLTASDGGFIHYFGHSVSISGDVAIAGAYQDNDKGIESGSAYIFEKNDGSWPAKETKKLTASDGAAYDLFGYSVSVSGDVAIVGAWWDDDKGNASGSAYIFGISDEFTLPVVLAGFFGTSTIDGIKLNWETQAETENAGFLIIRDGQEIASYTNIDALKGQGTTTSTTQYVYTDSTAVQGATYTYSLKSVTDSGYVHDYIQSVTMKLLGVENDRPKTYDYALEQNYPNPFNPSTTITYTMKKAGVATLKVYDVLGRLVIEQTKASVKGENQINFNGSKLTSGMYYYQLTTEGFSKTMKMMLVK